MALTYIGETEFVQSAPEQWTQNQWDLDQLDVIYSGARPNLDTFLTNLTVGDPSFIDPNMNLIYWRVGGSKVYPEVTLTYQGKRDGILPPYRHEFGDAIQSASSSWGSAGASIGTVSVQFYAPENTLNYLSSPSVGTVEADDPTGAIEIITVQSGNSNFAPGTTIANLATNYFSEQIVHTLDSQEMVAGKYWQNTSRKTKVLVPFIITVPAGTALITIGAPGTGYAVGNVLSISASGQSATFTVTSLGVSQSILQINVTANTFTAGHNLLVPSGGSGSGALFNVVIV